MALLSAGCGGYRTKKPFGQHPGSGIRRQGGVVLHRNPRRPHGHRHLGHGRNHRRHRAVPRCGPAPGRHAENRRDLLRHGTQSRIGGAVQRIPLRRDAPSFGLQIPAPDPSLRRRLRLPVRPAGRRHADRQRGSGPMAAAPPEQGLVRRAEFRVETAHLCRRVDIHDGRQPAHRLPAGTGADHAAALPNPPTNT